MGFDNNKTIQINIAIRIPLQTYDSLVLTTLLGLIVEDSSISDGVRTFVRTDICSNRRKVEQMSVRTNGLQLFWQFFKSSDRSNWPTETADHSLESLLQINKDGKRTKSQLERELTEKLSRKSHLILN